MTSGTAGFSFGASVGGRSSMVEPQIVVLAVAGSSPVGHPIPVLSANSGVMLRMCRSDKER